MDRDRDGLREGLALQREQTGGGVEPFLHDWREGALQEGELHLVGDPVELVPRHLHGDWIKRRT
jgi:hypothetical protein